MATETFGQFVRGKRKGKNIGLREMAKLIGVSPTYLSKIERDDFSPPVEDKVRKIAQVIGCDTDELLARAGRVASSTADFFKNSPNETAELMRKVRSGKLSEAIRRATSSLGERMESDLVCEIERLKKELREIRGHNPQAKGSRLKTNSKKQTRRKGGSL